MADFTATTFFSDFGVDATVGGASVRGIFDTVYRDAFEMVSGNVPSLLVKTASVPAVAFGDPVVVNATSYTVSKIEQDSTGMTRLFLEEV